MAELLSLLSTSYIMASNILHFPFRPYASPYPLTHLPFSDRIDLSYALRRFNNRRPTAFLAGLLLDIRGMRKLEEEILNHSSDETVMAFKSSHLEAVGGTQLTSAILAQLSMTTLQLDGLSDMHWSASGFMLSGILFGIIAVILATMQQQVFGMLNDPLRVKLWLSSGYYDEEDKNKADNNPSPHKRRLKASVASLQIMRIPNTFLSFAALAFLVSIGLFLGFSARQNLNRTPGRDNNKAVLILWLVTAFVAVTESAGCGMWKVWEDRRLERMVGASSSREQRRKDGGGGGGDEEEAAERDSGDGLLGNHQASESDDNDDDDDEQTSLLRDHGSDRKDSQDPPSPVNVSALAKALEQSAKAHARCAEADREVARLMRRQK